MPKAERDILIDASPEHVFSVITDYERYPEFLPEMRSVQVISRQDGIARVRFELELIMRISYTLRLREDGPLRLSWSLEEAKMLELNEGGWRLESVAGKTKATYALEIKLRGLLPKAVSTKLVGTTLPQTLERFRERAEGRKSGG